MTTSQPCSRMASAVSRGLMPGSTCSRKNKADHVPGGGRDLLAHDHPQVAVSGGRHLPGPGDRVVIRNGHAVDIPPTGQLQ